MAEGALGLSNPNATMGGSLRLRILSSGPCSLQYLSGVHKALEDTRPLSLNYRKRSTQSLISKKITESVLKPPLSLQAA